MSNDNQKINLNAQEFKIKGMLVEMERNRGAGIGGPREPKTRFTIEVDGNFVLDKNHGEFLGHVTLDKNGVIVKYERRP